MERVERKERVGRERVEGDERDGMDARMQHRVDGGRGWKEMSERERGEGAQVQRCGVGEKFDAPSTNCLFVSGGIVKERGALGWLVGRR